MKYSLLALLAALLVLVACGDDDSTGPSDNFSCNITLRDANGQPMEGYSIVPASIPIPAGGGRAATMIYINFSNDTGETRFVEVFASDCYGEPVDTLAQCDMVAGLHALHWNPSSLKVGAYPIHTVVSNNGATEIEKTTLAYHLSFNPEDDGPECTDAQGKVGFSDISLFPGLVCEGVVDMRDETGVMLGQANISPETWLYVTTPEEEEWEMRWVKVDMTDGANSFDLVWDDLHTGYPESQRAAAQQDVEERDVFLSVYAIPNPFN